METVTGVLPVHKNKFEIGTAGPTSADSDMRAIAEMESFSVSIDGNVEEWNPLDAEGWTRRMMTGKAITISVAGKRCIGDTGNDYVANKAWSNGEDCNTKFRWTFPSGAKLEFPCVLSVTNAGGGETRNLDPLEFDVMSDGKPTFTPASTATVSK